MRHNNKPDYEPLGIWDASLRKDYSGYLLTYGKPAPAQKTAKVASKRQKAPKLSLRKDDV